VLQPSITITALVGQFKHKLADSGKSSPRDCRGCWRSYSSCFSRKTSFCAGDKESSYHRPMALLLAALSSPISTSHEGRKQPHELTVTALGVKTCFALLHQEGHIPSLAEHRRYPPG